MKSLLSIITILVINACSTDSSNRSNFSATTTQAKASEFKDGSVRFDELISPTAEESHEYTIILNKMRSLLLESKYDELDRIANEYRTSKAMFVNGEWKLSIFYNSISNYLKPLPEDYRKNIISHIKEWIKQNPNSITARVALAETLVGYAFDGRGGGYASTVKEEGWQLFYERLKMADNVLNEAIELKQECPGWWAAKQRLTQILTHAEVSHIFDSAVKSEPTYFTYYYRRVRNLVPRWGGLAGEWERFVKSSADNIGGEEGDILYTRIVWSMINNGLHDEVENSKDISWERILIGIEAIKSTNKVNTVAINKILDLKPGTNLLNNPDAKSNMEGWQKVGNANIDTGAGRQQLFAVRNGGDFLQEVYIPNTANGYLLFIAKASSERVNANGSITGLPSLWGMVNGKKGTSYFQGQQMLFSGNKNEWKTIWGIFPITKPVNKITSRMSQAERKDDPQNGSAAFFKDAGLYYFTDEDAAKAFVEKLTRGEFLKSGSDKANTSTSPINLPSANRLSNKVTELKLGANLLYNPAAVLDDEGWYKNGDAKIDVNSSGNKLFVTRNNGSFMQDVNIPEVSTGYILMIAKASSERVNASGSITGLPSLWGMANGKNGPSYFQGQQMLFNGNKNEWKTIWGIFPITKPVNKITYQMSQAERKGDPQNGSAAFFKDAGLYYFTDEAAAKAFADKLKQ